MGRALAAVALVVVLVAACSDSDSADAAPVELGIHPVVEMRDPPCEASGEGLVLPYEIGGATKCYLLAPAELTARDVTSARSVEDPDGWSVLVTLTEAGSARFEELAAEHFQEQLAIVVDGTLLSAPTVQAQQFLGQIAITGQLTKSEAKRMASGLSRGS